MEYIARTTTTAEQAETYTATITADSAAAAHLAAAALFEEWAARGVIGRAGKVSIYAPLDSAAGIIDAARHIARTTARNMVSREGTPTQWAVERAAAARDYGQADYADMISAAMGALTVSTMGGVDTAVSLERTAAAVSGDYPAWCAPSPDDIRTAAVSAKEAAAIRARLSGGEWIPAAYAAAYAAVNAHLSSCRAIRNDTRPAPLSFGDIGKDLPAAAAETDGQQAAAETDGQQAAAVSAAISNTIAALSPTRRVIVTLVARGYSVAAIARRMGRNESTIREHMAAIQRTAAAHLAAVSPAAARKALDAATATDGEQAAAAMAARAGKIADITAAAAVIAALSPIRRRIWKSISAGYSIRHTAAAMGRNESTIREHLKAIQAAAMAAAEK